jgi:diacylglycerol kinase (ATP)
MVNRFKGYFIGRGKSFKNAFTGLVYALSTQKNIQIHLMATLLVIIFSLLLKITTVEFSIILLCIAIVWITEIMNTAIETVVNLCSPNYHDLARISKDLAAAAVLVSAVASAAIGFVILTPHIISIFSR